MITIGTRELRARLGKYLRLVRQGEAVHITCRGKPVGFLLPVVSPEGGQEMEEVRRLVATGFVRPGRGRLASRSKAAGLSAGKRVEELIAGDRR